MQLFITRKEKKEKEFQPVVLSFYVESIEELRLFFHICNRLNLKETIFKEYKLKSYSEEVEEKITTTNQPAYLAIKNEIIRQGFEV